MTANTRTLLVDGKPIGEIPISGDIEKDVAAVKAAMTEAGVDRSLSSLDLLLQQAKSFGATAMFIYGTKLSRKPWDHSAVTPFVVNSVFSIELYLKAVGKIFGKNLHGHRLRTELFDNLPAAAVHAIDLLTTQYQEDKGSEAPGDLRPVLETLNNAFVLWRYPHEGKDVPYFKVSDAIATLDILDAACRNSGKA